MISGDRAQSAPPTNDLLREVGVTDLSRYGDANAHKDIFVD